MNGLLRGRVALITGGGSGIGAAVARLYREHGALVVTLDRTDGDVIGDVRDPEAHRRAVAHTLDAHGRLDILVANAGVHDGGRGLLDLAPEELADLAATVLAVNVTGVLLAAQAAAEALKASRGCIVVTLSDAAFTHVGVGAGPVYAASKSALTGVVRALGHELAPAVRVNGVAPGGVVTGLRAALPGGGTESVFDDPEDILAAVRAMNPLGIALDADQVAQSYLFLASPGAAGLTGEILRIDGGLGLRA
ncbi:SDR family oxidoreductase [Streptomyces atratus]|uniref:SDR family oxidoreductase n=1 Tax=Streptomyces atratus TaxID=1893 RepID=UPI001670E9CD|nr:SDR family oxidoreductase [Streptomyces atratus]WPW26313.1 SDR family oxidoreductase [Streptomyces atratus]GGT65883.1 3-(cis-5,6-dihydroxycyclohexa-1, 3-dien-1-yl)propanoate dehydrogenase [Streptomyces atratus]